MRYARCVRCVTRETKGGKLEPESESPDKTGDKRQGKAEGRNDASGVRCERGVTGGRRQETVTGRRESRCDRRMAAGGMWPV